MKDDTEKCGTTCWTHHRAKIAGAIFIIVATLLTLLTLNGFGILGMFIVGLMLCRRDCCSYCGCYEGDGSCDVIPTETAPAKTKTKKSSVTKT
jgi:hypothetical protein